MKKGENKQKACKTQFSMREPFGKERPIWSLLLVWESSIDSVLMWIRVSPSGNN